MASLCRLSIHETSLYGVRAATRPATRIRAANYHYWASNSGKGYGRSIIYGKDGYYTRVRGNTLYARPCGSWAYRKRRNLTSRDSEPAKSNPETYKGEDKSQPAEDSHDVFKTLRHDASAAYDYLQKEIEKDPYKWMFDPKGTRGAWNPAEWWDKRMQGYDRRRSWFEKHFTETQANQDGAEKQTVYATEEEYTIDPITLRKVSVVKTKTDEPGQDGLYPRYQPLSARTANIPVKTYQADKAAPSKVYESWSLHDSANPTWLVKEGFTAKSNDAVRTENISSKPSMNDGATVKIEPSLDRAVKSKTGSEPKLDYPPKDITTDDVDLLRASDIRASSGHVKQRTGTTATETKVKSDALERDWKESEKVWTKDVEDVYSQMQEQRDAKLAKQDTENASTLDDHSSALAKFHKVKQQHEQLQNKIAEATAALEQARQEACHQFLSEEANGVKQSFRNFEQRSRSHVTPIRDSEAAAQALIDSEVNQAKLNEQQKKLEKLEKDAELVKQIRSIYEADYGTITADHKQGNGPQRLSDTVESDPPKTTEFVSLKEPARLPSVKSQVPTVPTASFEEVHNPNSIPLRNALYSKIDTLNISESNKKRFKFALRGVPELDATIPKPIKPLTVEPSEHTQTLQFNSKLEPSVDRQHSTRLAKAFNTSSEQVNLPSSDIKHSDLNLQNQNRNQNSEIHRSRKPEESTYLYKILALDNAADKVAVATTTSSIKHKSSVPRSAAGLLVHLDQPAKYFNYMESLDAEGFQLVSGSRTMLVYRKKIEADNTAVVGTSDTNSVPKASQSMKPLREEAVFSGHLRPKDRLIRSYQLAHRRAQADAETASAHNAKELDGKNSAAKAESSTEQPPKQKASRGLAGRVVTVVLVFTICYTIGVVRGYQEVKDYEEGQRMRREEAALRKAIAEKNDWKSWF